MRFIKEPVMTAKGNLTKEAIVNEIRRSRGRLTGLGVKAVGLFGSFVRGEARADSDVDLLVEFDAAKKNYDNFIDVCFLLEELLGRKVELVTKESLSPYIGPYILKEVEYVPLAG
jgi:predicted nucleotidyltransferase